jgi:hypothetical protein
VVVIVSNANCLNVNGIRDDNQIGNLELTMKGKHTKEHNQGYRDGFERGYLDGKNKAIKENST